MTTYNTYQEAKIANPKSDIYKDKSGIFAEKPVLLTSRIAAGSIEECNPEDHCMTVEQFLKDGHKFFEGDIVTNLNGGVSIIKPKDDCKGWDYSLENIHDSDDDDADRYILRAAALEKPKRMKVEYEPVNTGDEIITYRNDIFFKHDSGDYISIENHTLRSVLNHMDNDNLFRRVENEIDERQEFIATALSLDGVNQHPISVELVGKMYDSGKFKLVEGE